MTRTAVEYLRMSAVFEPHKVDNFENPVTFVAWYRDLERSSSLICAQAVIGRCYPVAFDVRLEQSDRSRLKIIDGCESELRKRTSKGARDVQGSTRSTAKRPHCTRLQAHLL